MIRKGMLIIISGPSGSGKGTVVKSLDNKNYALSISMTTRKPRPGEVDGKDYFFCTPEEFIATRENDGFLEHVEFCGNMYGTPKSYVEEQIEKGKVVILEIDVLGALQIKELYKETILVFMMPPTLEQLRQRLVGRNTEDKETIEHRIRRADDEIREINNYDYLIINDTVEKSKMEFDSIVTAEFLKPIRNEKIINNFKGEN